MLNWPMSSLTILSIMCTSACFAQSDEHPLIQTNSYAYERSYAESVKILSESNFDSDLESPLLGSMSSSQFNTLLDSIRKEWRVSQVARGGVGEEYDVILQPGHYNRNHGAVGTAGKLLSEQVLVAYITGRLAEDLSKQSLKVLVISADDYIQDDPNTPAFEGLQGECSLQFTRTVVNRYVKAGRVWATVRIVTCWLCMQLVML